MTMLQSIFSAHAAKSAAPYLTSGSTHRTIVHAWIFAAAMIAACGVVLFGPAALFVLLVSVAAAVGAETAMELATGRLVAGHIVRAAQIGLLLGLTLPATVPWYVPMAGSLIAIFVGNGVFGGYLHPALVGRVVVQFFFAGRLSLGTSLLLSPILAQDHLLVGDIHKAERIEKYQSWRAASEPPAEEAFLLERPVQALRRFAQDRILTDGDLLYEPLLRDALPPWPDTVFGVVPGGIGETCTLMIITAGLYLIYRGYLRWQLPAALLAAAALAAAIFPVELNGDYRWFPVLEVEQGRAVGLAYVLFHLTAGQLMLGAFILAGDVVSSPMRAQGQMLYAAGIGVLTIFMRLYGVLEGECYWSILLMNALVGAINRRTRRPVLGMPT